MVAPAAPPLAHPTKKPAGLLWVAAVLFVLGATALGVSLVVLTRSMVVPGDDFPIPGSQAVRVGDAGTYGVWLRSRSAGSIRRVSADVEVTGPGGRGVPVRTPSDTLSLPADLSSGVQYHLVGEFNADGPGTYLVDVATDDAVAGRVAPVPAPATIGASVIGLIGALLLLAVASLLLIVGLVRRSRAERRVGPGPGSPRLPAGPPWYGAGSQPLPPPSGPPVAAPAGWSPPAAAPPPGAWTPAASPPGAAPSPGAWTPAPSPPTAAPPPAAPPSPGGAWTPAAAPPPGAPTAAPPSPGGAWTPAAAPPPGAPTAAPPSEGGPPGAWGSPAPVPAGPTESPPAEPVPGSTSPWPGPPVGAVPDPTASPGGDEAAAPASPAAASSGGDGGAAPVPPDPPSPWTPPGGGSS